MAAPSVREGQQERRSYRLTLEVPVHVEYFVNEPGRLASEAVTITVNAHGALLRLPWGVPIGRQLVLTNSVLLKTQTVTVVFVRYETDGNFYVGVEFTEPNPTFWGLAFQPDDWSPAHPDAKQGIDRD